MAFSVNPVQGYLHRLLNVEGSPDHRKFGVIADNVIGMILKRIKSDTFFGIDISIENLN